jgi:hypothetical protein
MACHARPCAGHPRLKRLQLNEDVDGRDKPGHDGSAFHCKNSKRLKSRKSLIDRHNFAFSRIFMSSEMPIRRPRDESVPRNAAISLKKSKTL